MRNETCLTERIRFRLPVATQVLVEHLRETLAGDLDQPVTTCTPLTATVEFLLDGAFQSIVWDETERSVRLQIRKAGDTPLRLCGVAMAGIDFSSQTLQGMIARAAGVDTPAMTSGVVTSIPATLERVLKQHACCEFSSARPSETLIDCSVTPSLVAEPPAVSREALVEGEVTFHDTPFTSALRSPPQVEVQLPFLSRRTARKEAASLTVVTPGDGRIVVAPEGTAPLFDVAAQALLIPARDDRSRPGTLGWVYNVQGTAAVAAATAGPLASELHLLSTPVELPASLDPVDWRWQLALGGEASGGWLRAPGERDPRFLSIYSQLSVAVQRALRRWLPCVYFSSADRYRDTGMAWALIAYRGSRPFFGRTRTELSRDVLNPLVLPRLVRSSHLRVRADLARVKAMLSALGMAELAAEYAPKRTSEILHLVQRDRRRLLAVLSAEASLIDEFLKLAISTKEAASGFRRPLKALSHLAATFADAVSSRLRRLFGGVDLSLAAVPLFLEATRSLADSTGLEARFRVGLVIRAGASETILVNPNFRESAEEQVLESADREAM